LPPAHPILGTPVLFTTGAPLYRGAGDAPLPPAHNHIWCAGSNGRPGSGHKKWAASPTVGAPPYWCTGGNQITPDAPIWWCLAGDAIFPPHPMDRLFSFQKNKIKKIQKIKSFEMPMYYVI
jgi:hypothetical protein